MFNNPRLVNLKYGDKIRLFTTKYGIFKNYEFIGELIKIDDLPHVVRYDKEFKKTFRVMYQLNETTIPLWDIIEKI